MTRERGGFLIRSFSHPAANPWASISPSLVVRNARHDDGDEGGGPDRVLYGDTHGRAAIFGQKIPNISFSTTRHQASDDALLQPVHRLQFEIIGLTGT